MGFPLIVGKLLLPVCIFLGLISTLKAGADNGLFDLINGAYEHKYPTLVDSTIELRTAWTGFKPVDVFLASMIVFFSTLFEPANASTTLSSLHFYGLILTGWFLILVESNRVGNAWRLLSFAAIWGVLIENVSMAFIAPVWCLLHLATSPTAKAGSSAATPAHRIKFLVHPAETSVLPWAVLVGAGIPTLGALLGSPEPTTPIYHSRQFWLIARQFHPLSTAIVQPLLSRLLGPGASSTPKTSGQRDIAVARSLRGVYRIATYLSMVPHVTMLTLTGCAYFAPSILADEYAVAFHPAQVYPFYAFWINPTAKVGSVAEGAAKFLVWDETISSASILIWAWALNRNTLPLAPETGANRGSGFFLAWVKTLAMVILGGPGAAAVALIQERDEVVLESPATAVGTSVPGIEEAGKH